ncbi:MAG: hypothetical protein JRF17_06410 [Deltaproteobacteria bacterium]|nr:hypothetical protein [Deltaproteobacteria bacterium]
MKSRSFIDCKGSGVQSSRVLGSALPLAKKTASLIEIETFGAQFRNRSLLGFAIGNNIGKM